MKTKFYIGTLLAIAVHVMVKSQTPANQVFEQNDKFVLGYAYFTAQEKNDFSKVQDPSELMIKAEKLLAVVSKIKKELKNKNAAEKEMMVAEIKSLESEALSCQIAASEITAANNRDEFRALKHYFIASLDTANVNENTIEEAKRIYFASLRLFKIAKEMREEAYAQSSKGAIAGALKNAEENEMIAIIKINEAIKTLKNGAPIILAQR
jgi:hypothetical protein